jgi:hypothetical protein
MAEIIFGDVKLTVGGVPIEVSDFSWRPSEQPPRPIGRYEGSFEVQFDGDGAEAFLDAFRPRGYWLRRQLHQRRRMWRWIARQLGITFREARDLCRHGSVEVTR